MADNDRIKITISKSEDGSISVNTKMSEDATTEEAVQLVMDFIGSVIPAENVVHF